jgi:hypothetical protein
MTDIRLSLDPIKQLRLPKVWTWNKYFPQTPAYNDLIADFTYHIVARLLAGDRNSLIYVKNLPMYLEDIVSYVIRVAPEKEILEKFSKKENNFKILLEKEKMSKIVEFVVGISRDQSETGSRAQFSTLRNRKYPFECIFNEDADDYQISLDKVKLDEIYNPNKYRQADVYYKEPIKDENIKKDLYEGNKRLQLKWTRGLGLPGVYKVFCLDNSIHDLDSFWYKTKGGKAGSRPGHAFNTIGERMIRDEGCFLRYIDKVFAGLVRDSPGLVREMNSNVLTRQKYSDWLGGFSDGLPQVFDYNINRLVSYIIFSSLQGLWEDGVFYSGISFLELEYRFRDSGPFFVDQEFIINCIAFNHPGQNVPDARNPKPNFIIGDGLSGLIGEVGLANKYNAIVRIKEKIPNSTGWNQD